MSSQSSWEPAPVVSRAEVLKLHDDVTAMPDIPINVREDIFRIHALEMDWDIGVVVYEPKDIMRIPAGPDGQRVGAFLIHGGVSDYKSVDCIARPLSEKFGIKVASMTFPGRFYLLDPSRDWPGDVENSDGSARTPLWTKDTHITKDQYEIAQDSSKRQDYGTLVSLAAFERWETSKRRPNFKAEDFVHKNSVKALEAAARAAAARLKLSQKDTDALVQRYLGYTRELSGPGARPVPPFLSLHGINDDTVTLARCDRSLALFANLNPAPKVRCVSIGTGVHTWSYTESELPHGIATPVAKLWHDAITNGFFLP
ncbi:MAG: hypothetical protein WD688_01535 [Candidatus Binatia bacterium]